MKKNQLKGIFTELNETAIRKSAFNVFIESEDISTDVTLEKSEIGNIRKKAFDQLQDLKDEYIKIIQDAKVKELFDKLEKLETAIVQNRSLLVTDVKLTLLNQKRGGSETSYVVARAPFYNPNNIKAEIRAYLGKVEELGNDLNKLTNDKDFMKMAELELVKSMKEFITSTELVTVKNTQVVLKEQTTTNDYNDMYANEPEVSKNKERRRSPFQPGPGPNPKPKTMILGGINTKKD